MKKIVSIILVAFIFMTTLSLFSCDITKNTTTAECNHNDKSKLEILEGKEPTCQEEGLSTGYVCAVCGETVEEQEKLSATECIPSDWIVDKEPVNEEKGVRHRECLSCGRILEEGIFDKSISITLCITNLSALMEFTEEKIKEFKEFYPEYNLNITVSIASENGFARDIIDKIREPADVYSISQEYLYRLIEANALAPLDSDSAQKVKSENDNATVEAVTLGDSIYAYPIANDNGCFLYYDASIVSDEEAQTLEGIIAACEKANKKISYNLTNAWYMSSFFFAQNLKTNTPLCVSEWTYTGKDRYPSAFTDTFDSDGGVIAMKGMQKLLGSKAWNDIADNFANTGAVVSGLWGLYQAETVYGENMRAVKLPTFTVDGETYQLGSFSGYKYLGCKPQTDADKAKICNELALYLTSEEIQLERYLNFQWFPSNKNVQNHESVKSVAVLSALLEQNQFAVAQRVIPVNWWSEAALLTTAAKNADTDDDLRAALQKYEEEISKYISY